MGILDVLMVVLPSAGIATGISLIFERLKDHGSTRLEALKAAVELEGYAFHCSEMISADELAESSNGNLGKVFGGSVPACPKLPLVAGFLRSRRASVAGRLAAFPQLVQQADQEAHFVWDVSGDKEAAIQTAVYATARVALESAQLAEDLRAVFDLPARSLKVKAFDVVAHLKEVAAKAPQE